MPVRGDQAIQDNSARAENDGSYLKLKDGESITVYPMFFIGDCPDEIDGAEQFDYMPAEVLQIDVWLDKDLVKAYNDALGDGETRMPNVFKFELPMSYKKNPALWEKDSNDDPVAWLLHEFYSNREFFTHMMSRMSKTVKPREGQEIQIKHRAKLWFLDETGANRYLDFSPSGYNTMRRAYERSMKSFDTLFMQKHELEREGEKFDTKYYLNHISNDGITVSRENLKPLSEDDFGIDTTETERRAELVRLLVGTDEYYPSSINW